LFSAVQFEQITGGRSVDGRMVTRAYWNPGGQSSGTVRRVATGLSAGMR
jgi:hypothetical protein